MKILKLGVCIMLSLASLSLYCKVNISNVIKEFATDEEIEQMKQDGQVLIKGSVLSSLRVPNAYVDIRVFEKGTRHSYLVSITQADPSKGVKVTIKEPTRILVERKSNGKIVDQGSFDVKPGDILNLDYTISGQVIKD